jgi:glucose/arabinose dehydrogenase
MDRNGRRHMHKFSRFNFLILTTTLTLAIAGCALGTGSGSNENPGEGPQQNPVGEKPLPAPDTSHDVENYSRVIGWPEGRTPTAPQGFVVKKFASGLRNPRNIYVGDNGDIFVSEAKTIAKTPTDKEKQKKKGDSEAKGESANQITLLRDKNGDGVVDEQRVFLKGLNQPYGMTIVGKFFYVANTDGVLRFPYKAGQTRIRTKGENILSLPAGGYNNHWTRNLIAKPDGSKIYVSVGSGSNVGEHGMENEIRRANILEINPDGSGEKILASGLRNPVGMSFSSTGELWTAVNERDKLGDDLVPDYLTSVRADAFYGWPYAYLGPNPDPRMAGQRDDLVAKTVVPDVLLDPHSASLGLTFAKTERFPARYRDGAYVGQHGSWNRTQFTSYQVKFVPFTNGRATGEAEEFIGGFLAEKPGEVYGRPVGVAFTSQGILLVADDVTNTIWSVQAE